MPTQAAGSVVEQAPRLVQQAPCVQGLVEHEPPLNVPPCCKQAYRPSVLQVPVPVQHAWGAQALPEHVPEEANTLGDTQLAGIVATQDPSGWQHAPVGHGSGVHETLAPRNRLPAAETHPVCVL